MTHVEDLSIEKNYQFHYWSPTMSRPHSGITLKTSSKDISKLNIDNRNQNHRSELSSAKRTIRHNVRIPTGSRRVSPPNINPRSSTPEINDRDNPSISKTMINSRFQRSIHVPINSNVIKVPVTKNNEETSYQIFPKQNYEKLKITHERKRRKQQAQTLVEKYAETEPWFQLRRSLAELKRLATTQEIFIDPSTSLFNCDGYSFNALKQVVAEQQDDKKVEPLNSASGTSSSFGLTVSSRETMRTSATTSQNSFSRNRTVKTPTKTYSRLVFDPLMIQTKPIHPVLFNYQTSTEKTKTKPPTSYSHYRRSRPSSIATPLSEEKRSQLLLSDLSNDDNLRTPSPTMTQNEQDVTAHKIETSSPPLIQNEEDVTARKLVTPSPTRIRPPSNFQISSAIKLKIPTFRCHSATEFKASYPTNKNFPRFILIADQEHRIESWYHQYPFVLGDDLLTSFQSKPSQQKLTVTGYFIDETQSYNPTIKAKTFLQGKPFHINNDWKKYDVIFISNNVYEQIILSLQAIVNLICSSGKIIEIYQINHDEDLKKQVRNLCKQIQQQNLP